MNFILLLALSVSLCSAQNPKPRPLLTTTPGCDINWKSLETEETRRANCGPAFEGKCLCGRMCYEVDYDHRHRYVVNCTDAKFVNVEPLKHLPAETQVLLFTGNYLDTLHWNIFGNFSNLEVIDMSNNHLREISGKAFHHVANVKRLMLDFNQLSLDPEKSHPRIFSSFTSLTELHLTKAFEEGTSPRDLPPILQNIFINSNLTHLRKLHLEQNHICEFHDPNLFCSLPNLMDLQLGDNCLTTLHFNMSCLHKLRFLDLQRNKFQRVLEKDMHTLDNFAKRNQSVTVDFTDNPFVCSCKLNPFVNWLNRTKIIVRRQEELWCKKDTRRYPFLEIEKENCAEKLLAAKNNTRRGVTAVLCLLSLLLVSLICALIYLQRDSLKKRLEPVLDTVNKRVKYTSIATGENREVNV